MAGFELGILLDVAGILSEWARERKLIGGLSDLERSMTDLSTSSAV